MLKKRLIARLDIKGPNLIKSIRFEGLKVIGDPHDYAKKYYKDGIDEIIYIDTVATLYERVGIHKLVKETVKDTFIPITVAGGIRSIEDVDLLLRSGADKVAVNTAAVKNPKIISNISKKFGSQCMVVSIEASKKNSKEWNVYTDNGRENSGIDVIEWAEKVSKLGAGEILLTSVNYDGTCKGFDSELIKKVANCVSIPVIASGGFGKPIDFENAVNNCDADAVAVGSALHYKLTSIQEIKKYLKERSISIR